MTVKEIQKTLQDISTEHCRINAAYLSATVMNKDSEVVQCERQMEELHNTRMMLRFALLEAVKQGGEQALFSTLVPSEDVRSVCYQAIRFWCRNAGVPLEVLQEEADALHRAFCDDHSAITKYYCEKGYEDSKDVWQEFQHFCHLVEAYNLRVMGFEPHKIIDAVYLIKHDKMPKQQGE